MDNVTHTLVGLAMARTGLNKLAVGSTLVLLLSANAPDVDIVALAGGTLSYFENHRGYTHCLLCLPVMAALSVLVAAACLRRLRLRWFLLLALACLGVGSHLLLDWTNAYGTRLLLPFSPDWIAGDINNLTDGVLLTVLLWAAVWPWFAGLVSREIGDRPSRGRGLAIFALLFFVGYDCARWVLHSSAIAELNARLYNGATPVKVAALPTAFNPLHWTGIVETEGSYRAVDINALENVNPDSGTVVYKITPDRATKAAKKTEPFRYLQYFARFPAWSEEDLTLEQGRFTRVDLTDLRFGAPHARGFHAVALVDSAGRVWKSVFTFASPASIHFHPGEENEH